MIMPIFFVSLFQLIWTILNRPDLEYLLKYLVILPVGMLLVDWPDEGFLLVVLLTVLLVVLALNV